MTNSVRKDAVGAIHAVHAAFGAPGDYGYEDPKGKALSDLYKLYNKLIAMGLIAQLPEDEPEKSLELRLAECLAAAIDTPLLRLNDISRGEEDGIALYLGSFKPEISERAAGLLEEAGL
ncbi:hypothetical protein [Novosphingobium sp.]|uniref:hypothetical protein n=1 Tax=Novosphingobium sp. TaxID=1874826 RepID=UPI002616621B|nr:hypothetical protein [Novosphingobium sp.]